MGLTRAEPAGAPAFNLDPLLAAVAEAKWRCRVKQAPRSWSLHVPYYALLEDGKVIKDAIVIAWTEPKESEDTTRENRLAANHYRLNQGRQVAYNAAMEMLLSRRLGDPEKGPRFLNISPVPIRVMEGSQASFDSQFAVEGDMVDPLAWYLVHKESGTRVKFYVPQPLSTMTPDQRTALVDTALEALHKELGARTLLRDPLPRETQTPQ